MMYFNCMEIGADCDDCDYGQLYRHETGEKCTYEKCAYPERLKSVDFKAAGIALGFYEKEKENDTN